MKLAKEEYTSIDLCGDDIPEAGDFLLFGLGNTVSKMRDVFGSKSVSVTVPDGRDIDIDRMEEDPLESFESRVNAIVEGCRGASDRLNVPYEFMVSRVLVIDGWSWNEHVFRSPIWMNDHRDVPIEEARKVDGLKWLSGSSLEIELRPSEE